MHRITKRLAGSVLLGLMVEIMAVQPAHPSPRHHSFPALGNSI